jgi:Carboxypeptidase regulatory-like domain/TonB-dependent Receptor Plug Domain
MRMKKGLILLFAVALACSFAAAQVPTGRFIGKVTDEQGSPLPGVAVEATSPRLVGSAATVTDATGTYRLFSLPSGEYSLVFSLQGFKTYKREAVILQLEQTITLNVTLQVSTLEEEVTVIGQSPLIDVKSTTKSSIMTKEVFMKLPRNRDFNGLLSTVPGVQYEGVTGGLSVDGASGGENMFYIDGTNINNIHFGGQAQSMVMEQVEEVKVTASGYTAEFGGSMGGVVNVISRSGGNEFHGDLYAYYNNNQWMEGKGRDSLRVKPLATFPYDASEIEYYNSQDRLKLLVGNLRDPNSRYEGVFNLSGYVIKDRLWFFASFNPTYSRSDYTRWFSTDPVNLEEATVPGDAVADPRQGRPLYDAFWTNNYYLYGNAKLTAQPFKKMRMTASYVNNYSWYTGGSIPSSEGTSGKNQPYNSAWENTILPDTTPGFSYPNWSANLTTDYTVSNNFLLSLRGGWMHQNTTGQQQVMPGTQYSFVYANTLYPEIPTDLQHASGWTNWSMSRNLTRRWIRDRASLNLDMTYYMSLAGEHAWKGGVQFIRNAEDVDDSSAHPWVRLFWNSYYDFPDGTHVEGDYGYYEIRGDFVSPYGAFWKIHSNAWAIYLQDSWTIADKLTLNLGLRTESEYIPALTSNTETPGYTPKPINFGFDQKLAPRLGAIYDVFGDSRLKVFASYGIYYDVMKLYMAEGAYGGRAWWTSYYSLDDWDWTQIAQTGEFDNAADQEANNTYYGSRDWRHKSFGQETDPNMMPISQSELSFGAETKLTEELSFSARIVNKHLIHTIEDVGYLDAFMNEAYVIGNPGFGSTLPVSQGGLFSDDFWPCPKAKRDYWGVNLALEKRFSHNWQGGINYTWSQIKGNYGGLWSSDENGRQGPNVDRYFDLWFERYDLNGNPLDGILPSDRTHYFKIYGSYSFPFGLTAGVVGYGRSGLPRTTNISFNDMTVFPNNYADLGRLPFTFTADVYVEYTLKLGRKASVQLNATVYNATNTKTITSYYDRPYQDMWRLAESTLVLQGTSSGAADWHTLVPVTVRDDPRFGMWTGRYGAWSARFGARFAF